MQHNLAHTIAVLSRTPASLNALLRDLPEAWTHANEGAGSWTPFEVVGHLNHAERTDWIPRAHVILQHGESLAFDSFDREGHAREVQGKSLAQLLDAFARLRTHNLVELRSWKLKPTDLDKRGLHPSLGAVTLGHLLSTWAVHDLTHLHQIARTMAHQYRDAVGPFGQYLGVLQCAGHSSSA
jgi:hypothetical protein